MSDDDELKRAALAFMRIGRAGGAQSSPREPSMDKAGRSDRTSGSGVIKREQVFEPARSAQATGVVRKKNGSVPVNSTRSKSGYQSPQAISEWRLAVRRSLSSE